MMSNITYIFRLYFFAFKDTKEVTLYRYIWLFIGIVASSNTYGQIKSNAEIYFPMEVGHKWEYVDKESVSDIRTIEVTSETTINEQQWLIHRVEPAGLISELTCRISNNKVWIYLSYGGMITINEPFYDFSANAPDSYTAGQGFVQIDIESKTETFETPAGVFDNCYKFRLRVMAAGYDWYEIYAPDVGRIAFWGNSFYGQVNDVLSRWRFDDQWRPTTTAKPFNWHNLKSESNKLPAVFLK
jgi:hypothetical protein